jgi:hypothetical protein
MCEEGGEVFREQQIEEILQGAAKNVLDGQEFSYGKTEDWLSAIFTESLKSIWEIGPGLKYCVHGVITQNCGASLVMSNKMIWDTKTDGCASIRYQKGSILCILVVYGFQLHRESDSD